MTERTVTVTIDGESHTATAALDQRLIDFVRGIVPDVGVTAACESEGQCGMCTLLVDGRAVKTCLILAVQADGKEITTVAGLKVRERPHALRSAFAKLGAAPCGLCRDAVILTAAEYLREKQNPTADEVRAALAGAPCVCGEDNGIVEAVLMAATAITSGKPIEPVGEPRREATGEN